MEGFAIIISKNRALLAELTLLCWIQKENRGVENEILIFPTASSESVRVRLSVSQSSVLTQNFIITVYSQFPQKDFLAEHLSNIQ